MIIQLEYYISQHCQQIALNRAITFAFKYKTSAFVTGKCRLKVKSAGGTYQDGVSMVIDGVFSNMCIGKKGRSFHESWTAGLSLSVVQWLLTVIYEGTHAYMQMTSNTSDHVKNLARSSINHLNFYCIKQIDFIFPCCVIMVIIFATQLRLLVFQILFYQYVKEGIIWHLFWGGSEIIKKYLFLVLVHQYHFHCCYLMMKLLSLFNHTTEDIG